MAIWSQGTLGFVTPTLDGLLISGVLLPVDLRSLPIDRRLFSLRRLC